jgi:hypothetical protein
MYMRVKRITDSAVRIQRLFKSDVIVVSMIHPLFEVKIDRISGGLEQGQHGQRQWRTQKIAKGGGAIFAATKS